MVISDERKNRISIGSDVGIERLISYVEGKERAAKDQQRQEFVNSREYRKCMKLIEEGIMERKPYQNQFGAAVPTEYQAIRNITKRPETQVARYDKPNLDERQRAVDVYDEALNAGMDEADAIGMVKATTGMADEWLKCVPDWWKSVKDGERQKRAEKGRIRYSESVKKMAVRLYKKYREEGLLVEQITKKINEELGTNMVDTTIMSWLPNSYKKNDVRAGTYTVEQRIKFVHCLEEKLKTMPLKEASEKAMQECGVSVSKTSIKIWRAMYGSLEDTRRAETVDKNDEKNEQNKQSVKAETKKCECGREVPAEYAFCPYCGKKLETEKEKLVRYCKEVIAAFDGAEFSATEMKAKVMSIEMFIEREVS